jgi:predicted aconitase with swiveling domain
MPGYELRVVDPESGAMRRPGVPGELWVRGYGVTRGYHGKPDETAAALDADGWFHTGDLAVLDADGYLKFLGRLKDMLKVGGENVDPAELEAFLLGYAPVAQVKVVGIPDARLGEVAVACVVLRPGSSATEDDVIAFCRGRIASFKIPRRVLFVTGYPLTSTGKVQRFALRDRVSAMLEAEGTMANETHDEARLHAPVGFGPDVEAELVLSRDTFSIRYDMDRETGVISRHGHALEGMSLAGKIVYFPAVQGGVAAGWAFLALTGRGVAPAGVLFGRTNPVMIQGLVLAGSPVMHRVSPDPFTVFRTGDRVRMSPSRGLVERAARTGC